MAQVHPHAREIKTDGVLVALVNGERRIAIPESRVQEALRVAIARGAAGCTPMDFGKGVRVSDNFYKLRHRYGLNILTTREHADGGIVFGRYTLIDRVEILEPASADARAA